MAKRDAAEAASHQIVRHLAAERRRKGMSMNVLASRAGVSQSFISMLESSQHVPSLTTLLRIAHALEVHLTTAIHEAQRLIRESE